MPGGDGVNGWRSQVGVVSAGHLLSHFYSLCYPPLFPLIAADFGVSNAELGLLVAAIAFGMLLQIPVGGIVDRIGAKRVFISGLVVTAAGILLGGLAGSYPVLLATAVLSGIGQSAFHPADYAILEAVTAPDDQGKSFGIHTFAGWIGFAAAPLVVGALGLAAGWQFALLAVGAAGLAFAAFAVVAVSDRYRKRIDGTADPAVDFGGTLEAISRPPILAMFVFGFALTMAGRAIHTFTPVLLVERYGLAIGVGNTALTAYFAAGAVGILGGGILADRFDPTAIVAPALLSAAGVTALAISGTIPVGAVLGIGLFGTIGLASGLVYPSRDKLVTAASSPGMTGTSFGFIFTGQALGSLVSPPLVGAIIDASNAPLGFAVVVIFLVLAAGVVAVLRTRLSHTTAVPAGG